MTEGWHRRCQVVTLQWRCWRYAPHNARGQLQTNYAVRNLPVTACNNERKHYVLGAMPSLGGAIRGIMGPMPGSIGLIQG